MNTYGEVFDQICNLSSYTDNTYNDWTKETKFIKTLINQAQEYILSITKNYQLQGEQDITLTTDVDNYAIPSDVDKIDIMYFIEDGRKYQVDYLVDSKFLEYKVDDSTNNRFLYYTIMNNRIYLYPTPNNDIAEVTIIYRKKPTTISQDPTSTDKQNTATDMKFWFNSLIVFYAMQMIFLQREQGSLADRYKVLFDEKYQNFKDELVNRTNTSVIWSYKKRQYINPNSNPTLTY